MKTFFPVHPRDRQCPRCGFTLVELLTVMGIVMLLVSLLMPALSGAREKGRATACLNLLRQQMMAANMYLHDANDWLPPIFLDGEMFTDKLNRYLDASPIWLCPSGVQNPTPIGSANGMVLHYGVNHYDYDDVDGDGVDNHLSGLGGRNVKLLAVPDRAIYLVDSDPTSSPENVGGMQNGTTDWPFTSLAETRHSNGYNAGYLGGHVAWFQNRPNHSEWALPTR